MTLEVVRVVYCRGSASETFSEETFETVEEEEEGALMAVPSIANA